MKHSKLDSHSINDRELIPPLLRGKMRELVHLHSWSQERMPEYLWLGMLRANCTRKEFFRKMYFLKEYMLNTFENEMAKFSDILKLPKEKKNGLFNIIKELFGQHILDPLIIVSNFDKELRDAFYNKENTNDKRLYKIQEVAKQLYNRFDEQAMDVRYTVLILKSKKIHVLNDLMLLEALREYPLIEYNDERMSMYRSSISSLEGMSFDENWEYSKYFYEEMYLMSDCNPLVIAFDKKENKEILKDKLLQIRELLIKSEEIKYDHKKDVIMGNLTYIYKMVNEIYNTNLETSITSRLVMRTLVEIYINLKFMISIGEKNEKIWESFKEYGSGKYKNIYKKIEEEKSLCPQNSHLDRKILELLANELKSEEFVIIDFKNFAKKNIREKFIDVEEKNLYDVYYDYDTCFTHGYWSAIRESSLLLCDNPLHNYHSVSDKDGEQKLIDISNDYILILDKIINIVQEELKIT